MRCTQDTRPSTAQIWYQQPRWSRGASPRISNGWRASSGGAALAQGWADRKAPSSSPSRPGIQLLRSHGCPDATLGSFSGVRPRPRCPTPSIPIPSSASLHSGCRQAWPQPNPGLQDPTGHRAWLGREQLLLQLNMGVKGPPRPCPASTPRPPVPSTVRMGESPSLIPSPLAGLGAAA